jgi:hypothetical protein
MASSSLTVDEVNAIIDRVLESSSQKTRVDNESSSLEAPVRSSWTWHRVIEKDEWEDIHNVYRRKSGGSRTTCSLEHTTPFFFDTTPFFFGIIGSKQEDHDDVVDAPDDEVTTTICTFYLAYSTWAGRMFYVDQVIATGGGSSSKDFAALFRILAKIAVELKCGRLTWKVRRVYGMASKVDGKIFSESLSNESQFSHGLILWERKRKNLHGQIPNTLQNS